MSISRRSYKQLILWLIEGSRGGVNRGRIIEAIKAEPLNANQLCILLEVDYRTIRHHLDVLEKNHHALIGGLFSPSVVPVTRHFILPVLALTMSISTM